jgi:hypothetical protein
MGGLDSAGFGPIRINRTPKAAFYAVFCKWRDWGRFVPANKFCHDSSLRQAKGFEEGLWQL